MTLVSEDMYTDKLDNVVNKYNHKNHSTFKMKPFEVKSRIYTDFDKEDPKFKVGNHVRI